MKNIYFATSNQNKLREVRAILGRNIEMLDADLPEIQSVNVEDVVEDKVRRAFEKYNKILIVEDTGLYLEEWSGFPGALAKWLVQTAGIEKWCAMLHGNRRATAKTCVAYFDGKKFQTFVGEIQGTIAEKPRGENNFGWDPIFIPDNYKNTFAEMSPDEKNAISHRSKAFLKLKNFLS